MGNLIPEHLTPMIYCITPAKYHFPNSHDHPKQCQPVRNMCLNNKAVRNIPYSSHNNEYIHTHFQNILVRCFEETDMSIASISCVPPQESLQSALYRVFSFLVEDITLKANIVSNTIHVNVLK